MSCGRSYTGTYTFIDAAGVQHRITLMKNEIATISYDASYNSGGELRGWWAEQDNHYIVELLFQVVPATSYPFASSKGIEFPSITWPSGFKEKISGQAFFISKGYIYSDSWDAKAGNTYNGYKLNKN